MRLRVQGFANSNVGNSSNRAGLMVRDTLNPNSRHASMLVANRNAYGIHRESNGEASNGPWAPFGASGWLRITRRQGWGQRYTGYYSAIDNPSQETDWRELYRASLSGMGINVYIGIAMGAGANDIFTATDFTITVNGNLINVNGENLNQCDSVSYKVCGEFVSEFDKLYDASDGEVNPMRRDPNQSIYPSTGIEALERAKFPVEYDFSSTTNKHGIKQFVNGGYLEADLYDYNEQLTFPGEIRRSTGSWTLKRDKEWLRCGRYDEPAFQCTRDNNNEPRLAPNDEIHAIQCCADANNGDFWGRDTNVAPSWCPFRLRMNANPIPAADRCPTGTFDEAVSFCAR